MSGGKGKLNVEITAIGPDGPPPAPQKPLPKAGTVEKVKFQRTADSAPEDMVIVYGEGGRSLFSGTPEDYKALQKAMKKGDDSGR